MLFLSRKILLIDFFLKIKEFFSNYKYAKSSVHVCMSVRLCLLFHSRISLSSHLISSVSRIERSQVSRGEQNSLRQYGGMRMR